MTTWVKVTDTGGNMHIINLDDVSGLTIEDAHSAQIRTSEHRYLVDRKSAEALINWMLPAEGWEYFTGEISDTDLEQMVNEDGYEIIWQGVMNGGIITRLKRAKRVRPSWLDLIVMTESQSEKID